MYSSREMDENPEYTAVPCWCTWKAVGQAEARQKGFGHMGDMYPMWRMAGTLAFVHECMSFYKEGYAMKKYKRSCSVYNEVTGKTDRWDMDLYIISQTGPFTEFVANGRGSSMHAIAGPHANGNFLCLPAHGVGSELAAFTDTFWNYERLSALVGPVDATTLVTALKYLGSLS